MKLTSKDLKRISLKWECIRRSDDYLADYQRQETLCERSNADLLSFFHDIYWHRHNLPEDAKQDVNIDCLIADYLIKTSKIPDHSHGVSISNLDDNEKKWHIRILPNPKNSLKDFEKIQGAEFKDWCYKTFGGLIKAAHGLAKTPIYLASREISAMMFFRNHYAKALRLKSNEQYIKDKIHKWIDLEKLGVELKNCKMSVDLSAPPNELVRSFKELILAIQEACDIAKPRAFRKSDIMTYLKEYDRSLKKAKHNPKNRGESAEDTQRILRRYRQKANLLINNQGWRLI